MPNGLSVSTLVLSVSAEHFTFVYNGIAYKSILFTQFPFPFLPQPTLALRVLDGLFSSFGFLLIQSVFACGICRSSRCVTVVFSFDCCLMTGSI